MKKTSKIDPPENECNILFTFCETDVSERKKELVCFFLFLDIFYEN